MNIFFRIFLKPKYSWVLAWVWNLVSLGLDLGFVLGFFGSLGLGLGLSP